MTQLGLGLRRFVFTRDSVSSPVRAHVYFRQTETTLSVFSLYFYFAVFYLIIFFQPSIISKHRRHRLGFIRYIIILIFKE